MSEQTLTQARTDELEQIVRTLAGWKRPSASDGELRAAEWIAARFGEAGLDQVRLERESAHGGYWWPLGLLSLASGLAALLGRRLTRLPSARLPHSGSGTSWRCCGASGRGGSGAGGEPPTSSASSDGTTLQPAWC